MTYRAVKDKSGSVAAEVEKAIAQRYECSIRGRWIRGTGPIREFHPVRFWDSVIRLQPRLATLRPHIIGGSRIDALGVLFPEEHQ